MPRAAYAGALGQEKLYVSTQQALDAVKYLVRDTVLLHRLTSRVKGATAEMVLTSTSRPSGVDVDWLMQVLMMDGRPS